MAVGSSRGPAGIPGWPSAYQAYRGSTGHAGAVFPPPGPACCLG